MIGFEVVVSWRQRNVNVCRNLNRSDLGRFSDTQPDRALLRRLQNHAPEVSYLTWAETLKEATDHDLLTTMTAAQELCSVIRAASK